MMKNLQERVSIPADQLDNPAPSPEQLQQIVQAALSAPDHAAIRPWRFLSVAGDARLRLAEAFCQAATSENPQITEAELKKIHSKPLRSPMILTVIAALKDHPKVPVEEQLASAAAVAQNILLAANAMGFGAIWLTGPYSRSPVVYRCLSMSANERIVAFVYLGTPNQQAVENAKKKLQNRPQAADFLTTWNT